MNLDLERRPLSPPCENSACFGCLDGKCAVLTDNRFKKRCPFFKTREQKHQKEQACKIRIRLLEQGWKNG